MRLVLTGGCTGGHIYPALAIGDKFREKDPDCEIIYIAHQWGLETSIVPDAGYDLRIVTAEWLRRDNPIKMIRTICGTLKGRREALKIMKEFRPDVVMSTGSFVSVPVVMAAHSYGADIYMHEQNGFPGVSNRVFGRYAKKIFLGFEGAREFFKEQDKIIYSGNPVRSEFAGRDRNEDRAGLGIGEEEFVITIFGGSLGSDTTNDIGIRLIKEYGGRAGYTVIFGTGKEYYDKVVDTIGSLGLDGYDNVRVSPYISGMSAVMSASNLIISRAGALSVAEVTMTGRAAIFIPSPNVTADHQYYNALSVSKVGGAVIVRDNEDTAEGVLSEIRRLDADRSLITAMEEKSLSIAPVHAADIIYDTITGNCR